MNYKKIYFKYLVFIIYIKYIIKICMSILYNMISVILTFDTTETASTFLNYYKQYQNKKAKVKPENDRRGSTTKELHQNVKLYREEHPELTYRKALVAYSLKDKPTE